MLRWRYAPAGKLVVMVKCMIEFRPSAQIINRVRNIVDWHREQLKCCADVLPLPERDRWKYWDNNRLWCTFYFSIVSPGGSKNARSYLKLIEANEIEFELSPTDLAKMDTNERILSMWRFGTGSNAIQKRLGRFFSKSNKVGNYRSLEYKLNKTFELLRKHGFILWFEKIDNLENERLKARELEILPGSNFKVSRDFLNNIGMTDSLIPLDIHVLSEMRDNWGWGVPKATPSNRMKYDNIEDAVREIANAINCRVVEIDKAIVSYRLAGNI